MTEFRGFTTFQAKRPIAQLVGGILLAGLGAWLIFTWSRSQGSTVGVLPAWDRSPP